MLSDSEEMSDSLMTLTKLCFSADHYANINPTASRNYVTEMERLKKKIKHVPTPNHSFCEFCGQLFRPELCTMSCEPRQRISKKIKQLQRKQSKGLSLGKCQQHLLGNYTLGMNHFIIKCRNCGRKTRIACYPRPQRRTSLPSDRDSTGPPPELTKSQKKRLKKKKERRSAAPKDSFGDNCRTLANESSAGIARPISSRRVQPIPPVNTTEVTTAPAGKSQASVPSRRPPQVILPAGTGSRASSGLPVGKTDRSGRVQRKRVKSCLGLQNALREQKVAEDGAKDRHSLANFLSSL